MITAPNSKSPARAYVFREPTTVGELIDIFRLRYDVFREGRLVRFVPGNDHGLDVDCYDARSRHFGLYRRDKSGERLVGTLRVVENGIVKGIVDPHEVTRTVPEVGRQLEGTPPQPFPLMNYVPGVSCLQAHINQIEELGERIVEASRMALIEEERSLLAARHIFEGSMAIYWFSMGYEHKWVCCDASKRAFYRRYGVQYLPGTPMEDFCGIGVESACLVGSKTDVPVSRCRRLEAMAHVYARTGQIYCYPDDLNRFDGVDRIPLRATA